MDALDARILRELIWGLAASPLAWNMRLSLAIIARNLSVDEGTVRNRVRAFHETGFIRAWRTVLNPVLLGCRELAIWLEAGDTLSGDEVLDAARLLPGVIIINRFHGHGLSVVLRYRDEDAVKRAVDLFLRLARAQWYVFGRVPFPPCDLPMRPADVAILRCLETDPRRSAVAMARELGVTTRTVRRRLDRMIDRRVMFALPRLDPKAVTGALMAGLFVTYPADRMREVDESVAKGLEEHLWHVFHMLPFARGGFQPCFYNLFLPNVAKAREVLRRVHDLPGVAQCRLELYEDVETYYGPFEKELERLVAAT